MTAVATREPDTSTARELGLRHSELRDRFTDLLTRYRQLDKELTGRRHFGVLLNEIAHAANTVGEDYRDGNLTRVPERLDRLESDLTVADSLLRALEGDQSDPAGTDQTNAEHLPVPPVPPAPPTYDPPQPTIDTDDSPESPEPTSPSPATEAPTQASPEKSPSPADLLEAIEKMGLPEDCRNAITGRDNAAAVLKFVLDEAQPKLERQRRRDTRKADRKADWSDVTDMVFGRHH